MAVATLTPRAMDTPASSLRRCCRRNDSRMIRQNTMFTVDPSTAPGKRPQDNQETTATRAYFYGELLPPKQGGARRNVRSRDHSSVRGFGQLQRNRIASARLSQGLRI